MAFTWTEKKIRAAVLVAEDDKTNEQIAAAVGITRQGLDKWKTDPEFQTRVHEHIQALSQNLERYAIARKDKRMAAYQDAWERLQRVIDVRAAAASPDDEHGRQTGIVVMEMTETGIPHYRVDTSMLAERRNVAKQAAQEAGQWTERRDVTSGGKSIDQMLNAILSRPVTIHLLDTGDEPFRDAAG